MFNTRTQKLECPVYLNDKHRRHTAEKKRTFCKIKIKLIIN
jgi:hypothetical protein